MVKEKVVEAAHASVEKTQEVINDYVIPAAQAGVDKTKEVYDQYVVPTAQAGYEKTQEIIHDYVAPTAQAGIDKTQEIINDYVAPTAQAGKCDLCLSRRKKTEHVFLRIPGAQIVKVCCCTLNRERNSSSRLFRKKCWKRPIF